MGLTFQCLAFEALTIHQLYDLMRLRQAVFVVEQNCPYLDLDGKDQAGWHLIGQLPEGQIVAYTRLLPKGISYDNYVSIGRVVTDETVRDKGYGKQLMTESIHWCRTLFGEAPIKISAQQYLLRFYQSFGFEVTGTPYLEDDIPHIAMILKEKPKIH